MSLLSLFLILIHLSSSSACNSTEFITKSCNSTSFPSLCVSSLVNHACAIQQSPLQLTVIAAKLSLTNVESVSSLAAALHNNCSPTDNNNTNKNIAKALKDCKGHLEDAMDNMRYSLSQLEKVNGNETSDRWRMATMQTYMSAALTNEESCLEGMKEMKADVEDLVVEVGEAKKYTRNVLGLVNGLRLYGY